MRSLPLALLLPGICLGLPSALATPAAPRPVAEGLAGCGLEPPGSPDWGPVPRRRFELSARDAGPLVRRVSPLSGDPRRAAVEQQGLWGRGEQGALAGKTVYLSPGHGFTMTQYGWRTQRGLTNGIVEDLVSAEAVQQYLSRYLRQAGARVVSVREPDLNSAMTIVDDGERGGYAEEGAARFSIGPAGWGRTQNGAPLRDQQNPFALGQSRLMATARSADARAVYVPEVPRAGEYNVYVSWAPGMGRVADAHYVVVHPGGEAHFRVDQRRHGGTWVQLGRFYFAAGRDAARGSIRIENDSAAAGAISLDAVRLGGGMGLVDRGDGMSDGTSGRPRWEESARYHAQFSGAPPTVFDLPELEDHDDDVGTRSRFAAWDHEDGEDAVYVAWHTNAPSPAVGTSSYVYGPNPPDGNYNFTGVPGSDKLMAFVHDEIVGDIRRGWDPSWRDRGKYSAYFGEVNPRHNPETPATLIEVAFHETASDALQLRQAPFRRLVARAMYQGIARFFADKDGTPVRLLPEPPTAVVARATAPGQVTVSWRAAEAGPAGLGGDPAERFRVYRSRDGLSWDEGTEADGTSLVLDGVPPGEVLYLRVTAVNAGGESFPTALVPVRPRRDGGPARLLLVGGFERLDGTLLVRQDLSRFDLGPTLRMLLDQMNDGSYLAAHARAAAARDVSFDGCLRDAVERDDVKIAAYAAVDWQAGEQSQIDKALSDGQRERVIGYLGRGGRLLLSGSEIFWALLDKGTDADRTLGPALGVSLLSDDAGTYEVRSAPGRLYDGLGPFLFDDGTHGVYDVDYPDVLAPAPGARFELVYGMGEGAAAVSKGTPIEALSFGFPLEAVFDEAVRAELLGRSLGALGVPPDPMPMDRPPPDTMEPGPQLPQMMEPGCACAVSRRGEAGAIPAALLLGLLGLLALGRRRAPARAVRRSDAR